jgi:hypothetical protein
MFASDNARAAGEGWIHPRVARTKRSKTTRRLGRRVDTCYIVARRLGLCKADSEPA